MCKIPLFIFLTVSCILCNTINNSGTYAHNFDTDDNSTFLTLVNKILIENRLINESISNNDNSGNDVTNLYSFEYIKILKT